MTVQEENSIDTMLSVKGQAQTFRFIENASAQPAGAAGSQGKGTR